MKSIHVRKQASRSSLAPLLVLVLALIAISTPATSGQAQPATQPAAPVRAGVTPELAGRIVEDVLIVGNSTVSNSLIRNLIRTQIGDKFDPATVQEDYQSGLRPQEIQECRNRGVEPTRTGGVIVVFAIQEQKLIQKITFRGNRAISTKELQTNIDVKEGQAIDEFRLSLARITIAGMYRDQNYPFAHVEVPQEPLLQRGEVIFEITEGPKVTIRKVDFIGAKTVSKDRLRDQVKTAAWFPIFNAGKYDADQVNEDVGSLHASTRAAGISTCGLDES